MVHATAGHLNESAARKSLKTNQRTRLEGRFGRTDCFPSVLLRLFSTFRVLIGGWNFVMASGLLFVELQFITT